MKSNLSKAGQRWTKEEDAELKKRREESISKLAKDFERTETALRARAAKKNISLGKPN